MSRIEVRPGTDPRHPSVRVKVLDVRQDDDERGHPEISLVFDQGEDLQEMDTAINQAVQDYLANGPDPEGTGPAVPDIVLGTRDLPQTLAPSP